MSLVKSPNFDEIKVDVIDYSKKDEILGSCTIRTSDLLNQQGMEYTLQPWTLTGGIPNAQIIMSASLRGLLPAPSSPSKSSVIQVRSSQTRNEPILIQI